MPEEEQPCQQESPAEAIEAEANADVDIEVEAEVQAEVGAVEVEEVFEAPDPESPLQATTSNIDGPAMESLQNLQSCSLE